MVKRSSCVYTTMSQNAATNFYKKSWHTRQKSFLENFSSMSWIKKISRHTRKKILKKYHRACYELKKMVAAFFDTTNDLFCVYIKCVGGWLRVTWAHYWGLALACTKANVANVSRPMSPPREISFGCCCSSTTSAVRRIVCFGALRFWLPTTTIGFGMALSLGAACDCGWRCLALSKKMT